MTELRILDTTGDVKITWDDADEAARANARKEVAKLKEAGYLFFLVDGTPADEVTAAKGELVARLVSANELTDAPEPETPEQDAEAAPEPKRKGRKGIPNKPRQAVAVRPMRGG